MPKRIQRKRTKGWKMPANTVYVGRPGRWGNPYRAGMFRGYDRADAVEDYKKWMAGGIEGRVFAGLPPTTKEIRQHLRGSNLACWCPPGAVCHADILLKIANS